MVLGLTLVFLVGGLAGLTRRLSQSEIQIQALGLASGKILEWQTMLHRGGGVFEWPNSARFENNSDLSWQADVRPTTLAGSHYEMDFYVKTKNSAKPILHLRAEGWKKEETVQLGPEND